MSGQFGLGHLPSPFVSGHLSIPRTVVPQLIRQSSIRHGEAGPSSVAIDVAVRGTLRSCEAVRWVELGFRCRRTDTLFRPVPRDNRKRRGNGSGIGRTHPRAALSSYATASDSIKDRARARHSTPARDCACIGTCGRSTESRRYLSDANISAGPKTATHQAFSPDLAKPPAGPMTPPRRGPCRSLSRDSGTRRERFLTLEQSRAASGHSRARPSPWLPGAGRRPATTRRLPWRSPWDSRPRT